MKSQRWVARAVIAGALAWSPLTQAEVRVSKVDPASAAARAGMRSGDVIEALRRDGDGAWTPVGSPLVLHAAVAAGVGPEGLQLRIRRASMRTEPVLSAGTLGVEGEPLLPEPLATQLGGIAALTPKAQDLARQNLHAALIDAAQHEAAFWLQSQRLLDHARRADRDGTQALLREMRAQAEGLSSTLPLADHLSLQVGKALFDASELQAAVALLTDAGNNVGSRWPQSRLHAEILHASGLAQIYLGNTDAGTSAFEKALTISRDAGDRFFEAVGIERRGFAQLWRYDNDEARESLTDALARIREIEPEGEFEVGTLMRLALLNRQTGELTAAREYAESALALIEARPLPRSAARVWFELGVIASMQYKVREAEQFHRKALAEVEVQQPNSTLRTYALNSLGYLKHLRGDYAGAQRYYAEALTAFEQRDAKPDMGMVLHNIAYNAIYAKDYVRAEQAGQQALALYEAADFGASGLTSIWLILGQVALETGRIDVAEDRYRHVAALLKDTPQDSWSRWDLHYSHGLIDLERGRADAALEDFERALQIARRRTPMTIYEALPAFDSGRAHEAAGRHDAALLHYYAAIDAYEASQRLLGGGLEDHGSFLARHARYYRRLIALLLTLERDEEAFAVIERYRSRQLLDLAVSGSGQLPLDVPDGLVVRIADEQTRHDGLLAELRQADGDAERSVDRLLVDLELSRRTLAQLREEWMSTGRPERLASVGMVEPMSTPMLREVLPAGTLLLSYVVLDDATFLLSLRREGLRVVSVEIGASELTERIDGLRSLLSVTQPNEALRAAAMDSGYALYQKLVAPIASDLDAAQRLVVLADGALHALPFSALVTQPGSPGERPQYLIDRIPIATALSAQQHVAGLQLAAAAPQSSVVLFAREVGEGQAPSDAEVLRGSAPVALPFALDEAQAIGRLFGERAHLLLGAEATETRAKAVDGSARIVHFATHAVLNESMPMDSYLVLDASDGRDNGLLQAWEVAQFMRLDADLVTLAACDTLIGKDYGGAAQLGLHSAFLAAGARNVLGTLWSVSDRQTHALMLTFYRALAAGQPPDRALQTAQRTAADASAGRVDLAAWLSRLSRLRYEGLAALRAPEGSHWTAFQLTGSGHY